MVISPLQNNETLCFKKKEGAIFHLKSFPGKSIGVDIDYVGTIELLT